MKVSLSPRGINISRILSTKYMEKKLRNPQNVKRAPILAKNKYLYRPRFLYLNSPSCGLKENKNSLNVKFWRKLKRKRFKLSPVSVDLNNSLMLAVPLKKSTLATNCSLEAHLLTFSRPKLNNFKKSRMSRELIPTSLNMNSLQKSKRLNNKRCSYI